ncbi:hypothetical protein [Vibrio furnissii]|uniref:hypothetical protein n=1 Tax=Vibrio furnissii TaxID=29494 RepID=UPI0001B92C64|nr:hypothetical protein [Vibrio furnissii]EEX41147.1 hypothetical protein VFA_000981 [Vibrio furnissii CIP 102972]QDC93553.1 hypothetical protein FIU11_12900 [Vibrio furnissii]UON47818.1 hypothetical protein IUJ52_13375 [Vibrio furnissii]SUP46008.1 Uncharacterised protein [Vibrio furnissii]
MNEQVSVSAEDIVLERLKQNQQKSEYNDGVQRLLAVLTVFTIMLGVFFWFQTEIVASTFSYQYSSEYSSDTAKREVIDNIKVLAGFLLLFSTVFVSYLFMVGFNPRNLRRRKANKEEQEFDINEKNEIIKLLGTLYAAIERGKLESALSEQERDQVISTISKTVETQLNASLLEMIESKYGSVVYRDKLADKAERLLNSTISRLESYNEDLKKKASVNLIYGIASTIGAIMLLVFVLMNTQAPETKSQIDTVFYYTSRFFLVLLVQGVSIFFLNLYKSTLSNILYINNEITNHESKRDALVMSINGNNEDNLASVLVGLSSTERNFILKKGESSIFDSRVQSVETPIPTKVVADLIKSIGK